MASLLQGIKNYFWGGSKEAEAQQQEQEHEQEAPAGSNTGYQAKRQRQGRRPGSPPAAPVLQDAAHDEGGGVQGLDWFARSLQRDTDGELAHEALAEGDDGALRQSAGAAASPGCRVVDVCSGAVLVEPRQNPAAAASAAAAAAADRRWRQENRQQEAEPQPP